MAQTTPEMIDAFYTVIGFSEGTVTARNEVTWEGKTYAGASWRSRVHSLKTPQAARQRRSMMAAKCVQEGFDFRILETIIYSDGEVTTAWIGNKA